MKSNKGYVEVPREFFESKQWSEKREYSFAEAYLDLLQMAPYGRAIRPREYLQWVVTLRAGQIIASRSMLAGRWGWSQWRVRQFIDQLCRQGFLQVFRQHGIVIIALLPSDSEPPIVTARQPSRQASRQNKKQLVTKQKETETIVSVKKAPTAQQATLFPDIEAPEPVDIHPEPVEIHPEEPEILPTEPVDITPQPADITTHVARPRQAGKFQPPTVFEVEAYCMQKHYDLVNPQRFVAYYESIGWIVGGHIPMKSWRGAVAGWQCREVEKQKALAQQSSHLLTQPITTSTNPQTTTNHENTQRIAANPAATTTTTAAARPLPAISSGTGTKADACAQALECLAARESRYLGQMDGEEPDF